MKYFYLKESLTSLWLFQLGYLVDFSKTYKIIITTDKIRAFKQNIELEFWKTCICHIELDSSQLKDFLIKLGVLRNLTFLILCNEMCQYLKNLHNSVN